MYAARLMPKQMWQKPMAILKKLTGRPLKIARVFERTGGRMALIGLATGSFVSNFTGTSFLTQFNAETIPIAAMSVAVASVTVNTFDDKLPDPEKWSNRAAMLSMVLLLAMELYWPY